MLRKKFIYFLPAIVLILAFAGCEKASNDDPAQSYSSVTKSSQTDLQKFEYSNEDQTLEKITKIVDIALQNQMFRSSLKANAMKMLDGDYDVFIDFNEHAQRGVEMGLISAADIYNEQVSDLNNKIEIVKFIESVPRLQLSVPVNCESWDKDNYVPFVAFKPLNYQDPESVLLKAIRANEEKWLSTTEPPDKPVVVVGQSERYNENGEIIYAPGEPGGGGGTGGGSVPAPGPGSSSDEREDGDQQLLKRIKFTNISAVESWFSGKPETHCKVLTMEGTEIYSWFDDPIRSSVDNSWKNYDTFMFRWWLNTLENGLIFSWYEEDVPSGDFDQEIEISHEFEDGTEVGFSMTIHENDDVIGTVPVNFNDPYNDESPYHPGNIMEFRISKPTGTAN